MSDVIRNSSNNVLCGDDNLSYLTRVLTIRNDNTSHHIVSGLDSTFIIRTFINRIDSKRVYTRPSSGGSIECPLFRPETQGVLATSGLSCNIDRPLTERGKMESSLFKEGKLYCVDQVYCNASGSEFLPRDMQPQDYAQPGDVIMRQQFIREIPWSKSSTNEDEVFYCPELATCISIGRPFDNLEGFHSEKLVYSHLTNDKLTLVTEYALGLIIIDSKNPGVDYYVSSFGHVSKITSRNADYYGLMGKPDGVYVMLAQDDENGNNAARHLLAECLYNGKNIPAAQAVVLFSSPGEARDFGGSDYRDRQRVIELDKEIKSRETDILKLKQDIELQTLARKKAELAMAEASDVRKDHYESRSYSRKDSSEGLSMTSKIVMGVLGLGGAILGLVKALS